MKIPARLRSSVGGTAHGAAWLAELPTIGARLATRWDLVIGPPFTSGMAAWTAPVRTRTGEDLVLKISLPHAEARDEAAALRFWDGRGAVRLLADSPGDWGLLLERCTPGTSLADDDAPWRVRLAAAAAVLLMLVGPDARGGPAVDDPASGAVTGMRAVCDQGATALEDAAARCRSAAAPLTVDPGIVARAAALLRELPRSVARTVVVHGDLNPGNILSAQRGPARGPGWLAIDPKPLVGDPAYDPWPLLSQVDDPFERPDPVAALRERTAMFAGEAGLDIDRIAAWGLARVVQSAFWYAREGTWARARVELDQARTWAALSG
ncbi:MAG TPA: aminoglycoside phosphotransferase family protein [Pengzhenrongella sp.]